MDGGCDQPMRKEEMQRGIEREEKRHQNQRDGRVTQAGVGERERREEGEEEEKEGGREERRERERERM